MKGILINNGKALGDGSGKVFTVQSEKGNPVTVYTEGEMNSLIIAENVDKIFKYIGDDGDYTKDHVYQVVDENGTLTIKDLSMGIALPPVTNIQLTNAGGLTWDAPDTTEIADKFVGVSYVINVNGNELTSATNKTNVYSYIVEGENVVSVKALISLRFPNKEVQNIVEYEAPVAITFIVLNTEMPATLEWNNTQVMGFGNIAYILHTYNVKNIYKFDSSNGSYMLLDAKHDMQGCKMYGGATFGNVCYFVSNKNYTYDIFKFDSATYTITQLNTGINFSDGISGRKVAVVPIGTNIYIFGSHSSVKRISKFDTISETLTILDITLPVAVAEPSATSIGNIIYYTTGNVTGKKRNLYKLDIETGDNSYYSNIFPTENVSAAKAISVGPNIYIITVKNVMYKFDTITETMITLESTTDLARTYNNVMLNGELYFFDDMLERKKISKIINLS